MGFDHFSINTWNYDNTFSDRVLTIMSDEEKQEF